MADEFDDLDLDLTEETPLRPSRSTRASPYAVLAIALALACAYLIWERHQNATLFGPWRVRIQHLEGRQTETEETMTEVGEALAELSEKSAAEAERHQGLGDRKQALADLDRAVHLLDLAKDLGKCACRGTTTKRANNKLKELVALLEPTEEELPGFTLESDRRRPKNRQTPKQDIEPNSTRSGSPPPAEAKPEPRGEPDA